MTLFLIFFMFLLIAFIAALRSMKDFQPPKEIQNMLESKQLKGTIVFFKNQIKHYSSDSSSSRSAE